MDLNPAADVEHALGRFEVAVSLWGQERTAADLVDAAVQALVDGLWSQELGELAGMSASSPRADLADMLPGVLDSLGLAWPPATPDEPFRHGRPSPPPSTLRLQVVHPPVGWPVDEEPQEGPAAVQVLVDDCVVFPDRTGVDPNELFHPTNTLVATAESHEVGLLTCGCGLWDCDHTRVRITRDGGVVWWEWVYGWEETVVFDRVDVFDAVAYDAEVARAATDASWEQPDDTVERLVRDAIDQRLLGEAGFRLHWCTVRPDGPDMLHVSLLSDEYQLELTVPRAGRTPEQWAGEAARQLAEPPRRWTVTWHAVDPSVGDAEPPMAGPGWQRWAWLRP